MGKYLLRWFPRFEQSQQALAAPCTLMRYARSPNDAALAVPEVECSRCWSSSSIDAKQSFISYFSYRSHYSAAATRSNAMPPGKMVIVDDTVSLRRSRLHWPLTILPAKLIDASRYARLKMAAHATAHFIDFGPARFSTAPPAEQPASRCYELAESTTRQHTASRSQ